MKKCPLREEMSGGRNFIDMILDLAQEILRPL